MNTAPTRTLIGVRTADGWRMERWLTLNQVRMTDTLHEAGHAVAAVALALELTHVQMVDDPRMTGAHANIVWRGDEDAGTMLTAIMAGCAAELLTFGYCHVPRDGEAWPDVDSARRVADAAGLDWSLTRELRRAADFLQPHVAAVLAVAAALDQQLRLSGDDVRRIVAGVS